MQELNGRPRFEVNDSRTSESDQCLVPGSWFQASARYAVMRPLAAVALGLTALWAGLSWHLAGETGLTRSVYASPDRLGSGPDVVRADGHHRHSGDNPRSRRAALFRVPGATGAADRSGREPGADVRPSLLEECRLVAPVPGRAACVLDRGTKPGPACRDLSERHHRTGRRSRGEDRRQRAGVRS